MFDFLKVIIYKLLNKWKLLYQAICSGSIIGEDKVLTSTHCFLTNRKRRKLNFNQIRIVGGILYTLVQQPVSDDIQQWRSIKHLYSQRFYRFPAYNLAIVKVDTPWSFNQYVNKIPYSKWNQNFDGVCTGVGLKATTEAEGAGLVCHKTGDPLEDEQAGVLVGVTSLINIGLPSLHHKIGLHYKWVTDRQPRANLSPFILLILILIELNNF